MANVTFNTTKKNVGNLERWIATIAGLALAAYGLKKRSKGGLLSAAAGGGLMYCGSAVTVSFTMLSELITAKKLRIRS